MKVLVTQRLPSVCFDRLKANDVLFEVLGERPPGKRALLKALKKDSYDGVITLLTDQIDREVIDRLGSGVKIIANYAVGYNNIDVVAAKERGIVVTNTPGVLTDTVAEHTIALLFAVSTRIPEADRYVRKNKFRGWEPELLLGIDLKGKTLGIIGAGRIGSRVGEIATGMGMHLIYYDTARNDLFEKSTGGTLCESPEDLLRQAHVVSVHLPLTETTHHFLDERRLALLRHDAIVINTSRGPVIDERALTDALKRGRLFGAGLDVFEHEPKIGKDLRSLNNVVLTPHTASASIETRNNMAAMVADDVVAVLHGGDAKHPVVLS